MRKTWKRMISIFAAVLLVLGMVVPTENVEAAAPKFPKEIVIYSYSKIPQGVIAPDSRPYFMENPIWGKKITGLKNSNKNVVDVKAQSDNFQTPDGDKISSVSLMIKRKNVGTANISFKYNGKTYKTKIVVKKWESPCKSFKVGSNEYAPKYKVSGVYALHGQKAKKKVTVSVKPMSGWKLASLTYNGKNIKNNQKITLDPAGIYGTGSVIYATFQNTKTKEKIMINWGYTDWTYMKSGNEYPLTL